MKTKITFNIKCALILFSGLLISEKSFTQALQFNPQWNEKGTPFSHTWEGYASVDQAYWLEHKNVLEQIELAHKELKVNNIRTVGMFDDALSVVGNDPKTWRDKDRTPRLNFRRIDNIFESLLSMGVNPVVSTNFMPTLMAKNPVLVFKTGSSSFPREYKEWENLVFELTKHLVDHFGVEVVKKWDFEVWNEPNLDYFWQEANKQEFFKLWEITYRAIKSVNPEIRIGGPTTARAEWIPEFIEFGRKNNCPADYIIVHIYNNDSENSALSPFDGPQSEKINKSPNYLTAVVKGARKQMDDLGYKGELHFNEWGRSWYPTDETRDTQYEAAFIAKSMVESSQYADRLTYWCLTDIFDQAGFAAEAFYGGFGMFSMDGLKKPAYKAFELLGKLGDKKITIKGDTKNVLENAIATKSENGFQFMFYALGNDFKPGDQVMKRTVSVLLPQNAKTENIAIYQVGDTENNVVNAWSKMGKPTYLKKAELVELQKMNVLKKSNEKFLIEKTKAGNILKFEAELPGVTLVEINK